MNDRPASSSSRAGSIFAPFRHRIYLAIWLATLLSNLGSMIQSIGAAWLMTAIAPSAEMVALVQTAILLPVMLFSLPAGAIADIYDRRLVMLVAQIAMLSISAVLCALAFLDLLTPWLLLALTFMIGCGFALNLPAWQTSVREQVPLEDVPGAITLNSLTVNIARSVGPALGGAVVAIGGTPAAFAINVTTYFAVVVVLATWRRPVPQSTLPRERIVPAMGGGVRYVWQSPRIRTVLVRVLAFGLCGIATMALMPLIARDLVGGGPVALGLLLGSFGVGSVGGALIGAHIRERVSNEVSVSAATAVFAAATVVTAFSPWLPVTMGALMIGGVGWVMALATLNVSVQMSAPRWVVGRALSVYQTGLFGAMALGSWLWGLIAEFQNLSAALALSGIMLLACISLAAKWRLPEEQQSDLDPRLGLTELDVRISVEADSGPVFVTVEYQVPQHLAADFLAAMVEKRRIRRRDGARRWTLLQDASDPDLWLERFQSPSWADYLRWRHRPTVADREIEERVLSFHCGPEPPRVRRLVAREPGTARVELAAATENPTLRVIRHPVLPPQGGSNVAPPTAAPPTK